MRASRAFLSLSVLEIHGSGVAQANWYLEKLKTLYYHKITQRIHIWKNPEKYGVQIFPGIRIFPEFLCNMLAGVI